MASRPGLSFFGLTIARTKTIEKALNLVGVDSSRGGWWPVIREAWAGAWQSNVEVSTASVLTFHAVYSCITLIASDIGKTRIMLVQQDKDGIWTETENAAYSPVLRKPNRFQTRIKFYEQWMVSKLINGNTYVLKQRDGRNVVEAMYILDPTRVRPLVAEDGSVYYELKRDNLSTLQGENIIVPQSEIIHDVMVPLFHPLVGVSPITACGLAAVQGLRVQENSALFFENGSLPSGVLSAPGMIADATAARLKAYWDAEFSGANVGKVAVLGDGLKFEAMRMSAVDSQLIEQLKMTAEIVCTAFHVPAYMVGVGPPPAYNNIEALNQQYYTQTLQNPIESIEILLDEGLELKKPFGTEFDLDDLIRMDTATRMTVAEKAMSAGMAPNEIRKKYFGLPPVVGGNSPMIQQQNFSLEALAKRDASADPFGKAAPAKPAELPAASETPEDADKQIADLFRKELGLVAA